MLYPRLRDKGSKARELAMDLTSLKIPHQEAIGFNQEAIKFKHPLVNDSIKSSID